MELRRLEFLLDLAETENYSETAERMFTTQGNVSKQILALEKELETELIDRSHRKIRLTPAAKRILPHVKNLLEEERKMKTVLEELRTEHEQILRIQAIPVFAQYHVPELLARFKAQYPQIKVQITETEKKQLEKNLEEGSCDVIYTREILAEDKKQDGAVTKVDGLLAEIAGMQEKEIRESESRNRESGTQESRNLESRNRESGIQESGEQVCSTKDRYEKVTAALDRFAAVLPKGDPLAGRKKISLSELSDRSFLLLDEKTELFSQAQRLCRCAGFEPRVAYQGVRIDTILAMTASGLGVSLLMEQTIPEKNNRNIVTVALEETCESRLLFVRKKSRKTAPAVNAFWEFLKKEDICSLYRDAVVMK